MAVPAMKMLTLFGCEVVFMSCPTPTAVALISILKTHSAIFLWTVCLLNFSLSLSLPVSAFNVPWVEGIEAGCYVSEHGRCRGLILFHKTLINLFVIFMTRSSDDDDRPMDSEFHLLTIKGCTHLTWINTMSGLWFTKSKGRLRLFHGLFK